MSGKRRWYSVAALVAISAAGCVNMHGNPTLDAMSSAVSAPKPYVEAYIEFPGPQERWAGPMGMVVHVRAAEGAPLDVSVAPQSFKPQPIPAMVDASGALGVGSAAPAQGRTPAAAPNVMTGEEVRERLGMLATALQSGDSEFHGCTNAVRVRLVRADGNLIDKRGCRVQSGWAQLASEVASELLAASAVR